MSELVTVLGKSETAISAILSLNRLPAAVKDDCRNETKTVRSILVEIAKLKTPEKMLALYTRYKESGLTRGEVRKIVAQPKPADAPIDLNFINSFNQRFDKLVIASLTAEQKSQLSQKLVKLRGVITQKKKRLKA